MAQRIQRFNVTSPADNALPNYTVDALTFAAGIVTAIAIEIPSGHHGMTGIAIFYGNAQLIPFDGTAYMRGSHKTTRYEFDDPHPGGKGWFAQHFNRDHFYDHVFHLSVELDEIATGTDLLPPVLLLRQFGESFAGGTPTPVLPPTFGGGG